MGSLGTSVTVEAEHRAATTSSILAWMSDLLEGKKQKAAAHSCSGLPVVRGDEPGHHSFRGLCFLHSILTHVRMVLDFMIQRAVVMGR